jgi:1-acyl-sn-glycerol-3-phosphate acyltransferase
VSLLQRIVYALLKAIVHLTVHAYYPHIVFVNKERLKLKGPTIITGNHPNTLMDALNGALWVDRPVYFLAMARLFKPDWVGKILRFLFCIPLERRKDNNGGTVNNDDTFKQAIEHLSAGRNLFIAPDGGNELERNLLPLKTGTARIALASEKLHDYQLGLQILPLGYTYYGDRAQFGTEMLIEVGEPFTLEAFAETNEQDPQLAVRNLTAFLEKRMQDLLLNVRSEEEDQLMHTLEEILRDDAPLPLPEFFQRSKALLQHLRNQAIEQPAAYEALLQQVQAYQAALETKGLRSGGVFLQETDALTREAKLRAHFQFLPFWAFAWINHWPLLAVCRFAVRKLNLHIGYRTTVELCVGLLMLPFFYSLQSWLVEFLLSTFWSWIYIAALILIGRRATVNKRLVESGFAYSKLQQLRKEEKEGLVAKRQALSAQLKTFLASIPI